MDHSNKERIFKHNEVRNISPTYKAFRKEIPPDVQELADSINRLMTVLKLTWYEVSNLVKEEFGQGLGQQQFTVHFLNRQYGVGFRPREGTMRKYLFLQKTLMDIEKSFANPED